VRVTIVLFGHYAQLLPRACGGRIDLDVSEHATVGQVLDELDVPLAARSYLTVEGKRVEPTEELSEGCELRVLVPLGGG